MLYRVASRVCIWLTQLMFRVRVVGKENIPKQGGFILVANHRSNFDPLLVVNAPKQQVHFMAKAELFRNPILGWFFKQVGAFPVERGKGDTGALDWAKDIIRQGRVLGMFPEGTRSKDGKPLRPKSGAAMLAQQTGADVLPCAVFFHDQIKFRAPVTVCYGKLIKNEEFGFSAELSPHELKGASMRMMDEILKLMEENR